MVGRTTHLAHVEQIVSVKRSVFIALTGHRRIGKTYFVEESLGKLIQ